MRRTVSLDGEILVLLPSFPPVPRALSVAANSPMVINLSKAALIYRRPPLLLFADDRLLKVGIEKIVPLDVREQNTIMFHSGGTALGRMY